MIPANFRAFIAIFSPEGENTFPTEPLPNLRLVSQVISTPHCVPMRAQASVIATSKDTVADK
jgi:hypothetical protein